MANHEESYDPEAAGKAVTIVGVGEVGEYLVPQVARLPGVERVTLIDHGRYDHEVRSSIYSLPLEAGKPKAEVQAKRARAINPDLQVEPVCGPVEMVPWGRLRGNVILATVSSSEARRQVNQAAWRLGVPWIDASVDLPGPVVRVTTFVPSPGAPCLECGWEAAYNDTPARHEASQAAPSQPRGSPSNGHGLTAAGAVAAGLMAIECLRLFGGSGHETSEARRVVMDLAGPSCSVMRFRRHPECRFDHALWQIEPLAVSPTRFTIAQAVRVASGERGLCHGWAMRLEGQRFSLRQYCETCRTPTSRSVQLAGRIPAAGRRCPTCGREMVVRPSEALEALELPHLTKLERRRTLHAMGLRPNDVYSVHGPHGARHFEITGGQPFGEAG